MDLSKIPFTAKGRQRVQNRIDWRRNKVEEENVNSSRRQQYLREIDELLDFRDLMDAAFKEARGE